MLKRITDNLIFMSNNVNTHETVIVIKYINAVDVTSQVLEIVLNNESVLYTYKNEKLAIIDKKKIVKGLEKYYKKDV